MSRRTRPAGPGLNQSVCPPTRVVRLRGLDPDALADWLEPVLPHLGDDESLPFLTRVHIRLGHGRMHAMATDRYSGAITTLPVRTEANARITIPGAFARRMIEALRPSGEGCGTQAPARADLTIAPQLFGLAVHTNTPVTCWCEGDYDVQSARMAVRLDPDSETIDLPAAAAKALAEPASTDPVHIDVRLLTRFFTYGPVIPLDTASGQLLPGSTDLLTRYAAHSTGRIIILTRPDFLGILAACRTDPPRPEERRAAALAETRTAWRHQLAQIS